MFLSMDLEGYTQTTARASAGHGRQARKLQRTSDTDLQLQLTGRRLFTLIREAWGLFLWPFNRLDLVS